MATIKHLEALEILDSRGDPTLQVTATLSDGSTANASVPSGASTGRFEAHELRDGERHRFGGKGVTNAVRNVSGELRQALVGTDVHNQGGIDHAMIDLDGTPNKSRLGANAILGVSLAVARAAAHSARVPLYRYLHDTAGMGDGHYRMPIPLINLVNGGRHASTNVNLQEFWVIPHFEATFRERIRSASEIFHALGARLVANHMDTDVGHEGGYAPDVSSHQQIMQFIVQAIEETERRAGEDVSLGIDAGSSTFFDLEKKTYSLPLEKKEFSNAEYIDWWLELVEGFPIAALEDPLAEEEWSAWQELTARLKLFNKSIKLIGDDLFVTNRERLQKGITTGVANAVLIKPNQIGTLTETLDCIRLARDHGYGVIISHRSGETIDTFIADLAVAVSADYIKSGCVSRGERVAKYNRIMEIEEELYGGRTQ